MTEIRKLLLKPRPKPLPLPPSGSYNTEEPYQYAPNRFIRTYTAPTYAEFEEVGNTNEHQPNAQIVQEYFSSIDEAITRYMEVK